MGAFTVIPQDTFQKLQLDAGVLLTTFDPTAPAVTDANIICATTGGIQVTATPTFTDMGEDVDNCPNNMKELKHLDGWECTISTTGLGTSPALIAKALGAAAVGTGADANKVTLDAPGIVEEARFSTIWWVGDRADGGCVAAKLDNALATGGFSLQTGKNAKGQTSITFTGHVSMSAQTTMPMEFYSIDA